MEVAHDAATGGLSTLELRVEKPGLETEAEGLSSAPPTLGSLPVGARLILRCRADWRAATVAAFEPERVVLNVASPKGHTYRVRRPSDSPLSLDGGIPVLGEGCWRAGLARYDARW
jgi:hypothetical protein